MHQEAELVVLKHVNTLVVGPQVVYLLLEHRTPKVFTDSLHYVQLVFEAGKVFGQPVE